MKEEYEIIQKYCGNIEKRIQVCRSKAIAESLVEQLCIEVNDHCHSHMIQNLLKHHCRRIIDYTFDSQGKKLFLEENHENT